MGERTYVNTNSVRHARSRTRKHKQKIKEERQSLEVAWSCFPISATRDNKRPSVPTVGTLSGLQKNANAHTHTHTGADARTPLQIHSSSEKPI